MNELVNEFKTKGPFSADIKPEEALAIIEQMKAKLAKLKEEEQELRKGLSIFRIDHPFSKEIQNLEKVCLSCYLSLYWGLKLTSFLIGYRGS